MSNGNGTAIELFTGTPEARARQWADMPADERHRRAAQAANERDARVLASLMEAETRVNSGRVSEHTLRAYRRGLDVWLDFCERHGVNVLRPGRDDGGLFRMELQKGDLSPASVRVYMAGVRAVYRALRWSHASEAAPLADVRPPSDTVAAWDKRQPYSAEVVRALLEHANPRDRVMVLLGAHAGLRVSEAAGLRWGDVDLVTGTLTVEGKGGKVRRPPISGTLHSALQSPRIVATDSDAQVLGGIGAPAIRARMRRLAARAGVAYLGYHALRHHAATYVLTDGRANVIEVQRFLGHASPSTTSGYAHTGDSAVRAVLSER